MSHLHHAAPHESAIRHVTGTARYVDDLPEPPGTLHGALVLSPHARARFTDLDVQEALSVPGVVRVLSARDIKGHRHIGPIVHDEELLATEVAEYRGHPVALVLATSADVALRAAARVQARWEPLPAVLDVEAAIHAGAFHTAPHRIQRGDVDAALGQAAHRLTGRTTNGYQDHFYLETQASLATPLDDGGFHIWSSTQHPTECQKLAAAVLGVGAHRVVVECARMGGGFGGKESQAAHFACLAALGAQATGHPVKIRLDRETDMRVTGKRHPFVTHWEAGFDADGHLLALRAELYSNGGHSLDLSGSILDRALFHLDNAYFIPNVDVVGRVCRTNLPSNTAFRGFGGPQGVLVIESVMERAAEHLGMDPAEIRRRNYYAPGRDTTHYGQHLRDIRLARIHEELIASADWEARRQEIQAFNERSRWTRRGIAWQPLKFGISFTANFLNQAGALVHVYTDGSVQIHHGGTEMGQGLYTKMIAVAADIFGLPTTAIRCMNTATDKVPNTSPTAASSGTDLNGAAVREACLAVRDRMAAVARARLGLPESAPLVWGAGRVAAADDPSRSLGFGEVATQSWLAQVSLSATGYYRTPGIWYDREAGRGEPFFYFAYGAAVVEVEVNGLTGEHRLRRVDILHDVGDALNPAIDRGQVEGAFIQGVGWLTCEELRYADDGRLLTAGPSTYKIPACGDAPAVFHVNLLQDAPCPGVVGGSKAVGEPPLLLGIGVVSALRSAIAAFGPPGRPTDLALPATPEAVLRAIVAQRQGAA